VDNSVLRLKAGSFDLAFDPAVGNIRQFSVAGRGILHRAHWVGTKQAQAAGSVIDAHLAGDFLAAPFGASDLVNDPPHGWSANSPWALQSHNQSATDAQMVLTLERPVMGAQITKEITLRAAHPVLYQRHRIAGGTGGLTFAHHPMIRVSGGDHIAVSPKRAALTPEEPLEPAHLLACPARSAELMRFPSKGGQAIDLSYYPQSVGHEDFVTLVESDTEGLGWTAVSRARDGDIVIFVKDSRVMPVTMFWMSNGGRGYAPWDGRHVGVLGVEDGCAAGAAGHRAALGDNAVAREGVATALTLGAGVEHVLRHAIAVIAQPEGWRGVADIRFEDDRMRIIGQGGEVLFLPFETAFFAS